MNKLLAVLAVLVVCFGGTSTAVAGDKDTVDVIAAPMKSVTMYACDTTKNSWAPGSSALAVTNLGGKLATEAPAFIKGLADAMEAAGYSVTVAKDCHINAGTPAVIAAFKTFGVSMDEGVILVQTYKTVGTGAVIPVKGQFFIAGPDGGAREAGGDVAATLLAKR